MPSLTNTVLLAAAGSRKTEYIVDSALGVDPSQRVLITTYTNSNQQEITRRLWQRVGHVPANIVVMGWFSFLMTHGAKPYQRTLTSAPFAIRGLNFKGEHAMYTAKTDTRRYYFDKNYDMFRDDVSDFVVRVNEATNGAVINRIERVFPFVFIDEVQDLAGWDLEVLDLLFESSSNLLMVGDPRQHILETNVGTKNQRFRGVGMIDWFEKRAKVCELVHRTESYRCNQAICDFADAIFPDLPRTTSVNVTPTDNDGVHELKRVEVSEYLAQHPNAVVLRRNRSTDTLGHPAVNFGVAKGATYDRVVIFPTANMRKFFATRDPTGLTEPERLYVAVTRARWSVAIVTD